MSGLLFWAHTVVHLWQNGSVLTAKPMEHALRCMADAVDLEMAALTQEMERRKLALEALSKVDGEWLLENDETPSAGEFGG